MPLTWPQSGTIEFEDYGLQYRKGLELALKGVTLHINEREKVSHLPNIPNIKNIPAVINSL